VSCCDRACDELHASCRGSDPAARAAVTNFVLSSPGSQAAQYNLTVGQVLAVLQYLEGIMKTVVAPVFQASVLGLLGGQHSGGLVVSRTVGQWIDGDTSSAS